MFGRSVNEAVAMGKIADMDSIVPRLIGIRHIVRQIMDISGTVGLSYGVIHRGKIVHIDNFGFRDVDRQLLITEETIMPVCSITKGLFTSVLGDLVDQGRLKWDAKVHELLPDFAPSSDTLRDRAVLLDFLSMRSGIEGYNIWTQSDNRVNFAKSDSLKLINSLGSVSDLRDKFAYNNWGYEIADHVCRAVAGDTWDNILHKTVFEPLGLTRTDARGDREGFDNVARSYMALDDRTPVQVPTADMSGKTLMGTAGGVVSCIKDLLQIYQVMLKACVHQFETGLSSTPGNPFKNLAITMSAHTIFPGPSFHESSYGLAWIRTQLPNQMCKIGSNYNLLGEAPVIGRGAPSKLIIAHYGSMPGNFAGVNLFPETESAIVLLANSTPMCDIADWITQLLTLTLFDFPEKVDFVEWVQKTVDAELNWYSNVVKDMGCEKKKQSSATNGIDYLGKYYNATSTLLMEIRDTEEGLCLLWDGRDEDIFPLKPCGEDTFSWLLPRNNLVMRGRATLQSAPYYQIRFARNDEGRVNGLVWKHDSRAAEGERYIKNENT